MSTLAKTQPLGPAIVFAAAAAGTAIALYYYFTPLTGITGAPGTLLVVASSILLALDAVILLFSRRGVVFWIFWVLGLLGVAGTVAAAVFLHGWLLVAAMAVVLVGLLACLFLSRKS